MNKTCAPLCSLLLAIFSGGYTPRTVCCYWTWPWRVYPPGSVVTSKNIYVAPQAKFFKHILEKSLYFSAAGDFFL